VLVALAVESETVITPFAGPASAPLVVLDAVGRAGRYGEADRARIGLRRCVHAGIVIANDGRQGIYSSARIGIQRCIKIRKRGTAGLDIQCARCGGCPAIPDAVEYRCIGGIAAKGRWLACLPRGPRVGAGKASRRPRNCCSRECVVGKALS
jgi:hypothetical protein